MTDTSVTPCPTCGGPRRHVRDRWECTPCRRAYERQWRAANPDKVREHRRKDREAHRDRQYEAHRRWRERNREKVRAWNQRYRARQSETTEEPRRDDTSSFESGDDSGMAC